MYLVLCMCTVFQIVYGVFFLACDNQNPCEKASVCTSIAGLEKSGYSITMLVLDVNAASSGAITFDQRIYMLI